MRIEFLNYNEYKVEGGTLNKKKALGIAKMILVGKIEEANINMSIFETINSFKRIAEDRTSKEEIFTIINNNNKYNFTVEEIAKAVYKDLARH